MQRLTHRWLLALLVCMALGAVRFANAADHGGASTDHAAGGRSGDVPLEAKPDLAIWSLVTFVVFLLVLKKVAWGPLMQGLEDRESHVRNQLAATEEAHRKARELLAQHAEKLNKVADEVKAIIAEARSDAEHLKQEIVTEARSEADSTRKRAIEDIEHARDLAIADLFRYMSDGIADATEHILGRRLDDEDNKRLIDEALTQFADRSR